MTFLFKDEFNSPVFCPVFIAGIGKQGTPESQTLISDPRCGNAYFRQVGSDGSSSFQRKVHVVSIRTLVVSVADDMQIILCIPFQIILYFDQR